MKEFMRRIGPRIKKIYHKISDPPIPNNKGAREIEYSWIFANIPKDKGLALDLGIGNSYTSLVAARKGYEVIATDLKNIHFNYIHHRIEFIKKDIFKMEIKPNKIDLIINCSTIEHIGLKGRYNIKKEFIDADLDAMKLLHILLKKNKIMIMTIPVGEDIVMSPYHRIYGIKRLPKLLKHWEIEKEEFWIKNHRNQWIQRNKEETLSIKTSRHYYGLGLFILS